MTNDITLQRPKTGRILKEDSTVFNVADMYAAAGVTGTILPTSLLLANGTYTQTTVDRMASGNVPAIVWGYAYSNRASAAAGWVLEESDASDMAGATTIASQATSASTLSTMTQQTLTKRYFRFTFTNGAAGTQATFVLIQGTATAISV